MFHVKHFIIPNVGLFHVKHFGQFTSAEVFASAFIFSGFDRRQQKNPFPHNRRRKTEGRDSGSRFPSNGVAEMFSVAAGAEKSLCRDIGGGRGTAIRPLSKQ